MTTPKSREEDALPNQFTAVESKYENDDDDDDAVEAAVAAMEAHPAIRLSTSESMPSPSSSASTDLGEPLKSGAGTFEMSPQSIVAGCLIRHLSNTAFLENQTTTHFQEQMDVR